MSPLASSLLALCAVVTTSANYLDGVSNSRCSAVDLGQTWDKRIPIYIPPIPIFSSDSSIRIPDNCASYGLYLQGTEVVVCNVEPYGPAPELVPDNIYSPLSRVRVLCRPELSGVNQWCPLGLVASTVQYCSRYQSSYIGRDGAPDEE